MRSLQRWITIMSITYRVTSLLLWTGGISLVDCMYIHGMWFYCTIFFSLDFLYHEYCLLLLVESIFQHCFCGQEWINHRVSNCVKLFVRGHRNEWIRIRLPGPVVYSYRRQSARAHDQVLMKVWKKREKEREGREAVRTEDDYIHSTSFPVLSST